MNECLKQETLIDLLLGESSPDVQLHLRSCAACSAAYKNLTQDMRFIETALSAPPPPVPVSLRLGPWMRALAPALAAAAAVFIAGFYLGQRFLPSHSEIVSASAADSLSAQSGSLALAERGAKQAGGEGESPSVSYVTFLQDNFERDDTCLSQDHAFNPACSRSWMAENR